MASTNLEAIKQMALDFLYMDIKENQYSPMIVCHPIFNSGFVQIKTEKGFEILNILEDDQAYTSALKNVEARIKKSNQLSEVFLIIRKPYRLTFLKFVKPFMSERDFGKMLSEIWVESEDPNNDVNVPISLSAKWFRKTNRLYLMSEKEYQKYLELPSEIILYRGVAIGRNPKGLSWTDNRKKAMWFAHRFDTDDKQGYVLSKKISKENILAVFDRGEDEILVDTTKIKL